MVSKVSDITCTFNKLLQIIGKLKMHISPQYADI